MCCMHSVGIRLLRSTASPAGGPGDEDGTASRSRGHGLGGPGVAWKWAGGPARAQSGDRCVRLGAGGWVSLERKEETGEGDAGEGRMLTVAVRDASGRRTAVAAAASRKLSVCFSTSGS
ncbi:hypothetical protein C8Q77DRAFT_273294 [Trametes polyzona]|nr:hypothetical protein C8Q77DRAFT_273294 [Trametes polyzona]